MMEPIQGRAKVAGSVIALFLLSLTGCTETEGTLGGAAVGTAGGAGIGYAVGGKGGAALGGVLGGLAGGAVGNHAASQSKSSRSDSGSHYERRPARARYDDGYYEYREPRYDRDYGRQGSYDYDDRVEFERKKRDADRRNYENQLEFERQKRDLEQQRLELEHQRRELDRERRDLDYRR